jgi:hypothetical protein
MRFPRRVPAAGAALLVAAAAFADRAGAQLVLNELLPAPGTDWTGNGIYSSSEDEWVEIFNAGSAPADLTDHFVTDGAGPSTPRIGLSGSLAPGEHLFLTGELAVDWEAANGFPAVGLSLNNSGDTVSLFRASGGDTTLLDELTYTSGDVNTDVSLGRLPDGDPAWTPFDALAPGGTGPQPTPGGQNGGPATPKILSVEIEPTFPTSADPIGVRATAGDADGVAECVLRLTVDGGGVQSQPMSLVEGTVHLGTWEIVIPAQPEGTVLGVVVRVSDGALLEETNEVEIVVGGSDSPIALNEILADPPAGLEGDANGDGVRSTSDDEFIEVINRSGEPQDITGWSLHDATGLRHEFGEGGVLGPGEIFVVFGGGTPTGIPSGATVASTGGLSLNNTGDEVRLVNVQGVTADAHAYGSEAGADESLIRLPDGHGEWTRPSDAGFGWSFSPGAPNGSPSALPRESWARVKALYRP